MTGIIRTLETERLFSLLNLEDREFVARMMHENFPPEAVTGWTIASLRQSQLESLKKRLAVNHDLF